MNKGLQRFLYSENLTVKLQTNNNSQIQEKPTKITTKFIQTIIEIKKSPSFLSNSQPKMYNSYEPYSMNENFLQSKPLSKCIQQSEYIIQDNVNLSQTNKENYSHHLNKSNFSHYNKMSKSNHSHVSMGKSGIMASKSQSFIMAESKARQLMQSNRSKLSQKSLLKSYNAKMGPALKVLTQSDLTQNDQDQDHIFSDSQPQPAPQQNRASQKIYKLNKNTITQSQYQRNMSKSNHPLFGVRKISINNDLMKHQDQNPQKRQQKAFNQSSKSDYENQSELQQIPIRDFTFIPNQKLQIKHYSPLNRNKISFSQLIGLLPHSLNAFKKIKKLSIINCFMNSLQGIEELDCLQQVNLRKNELTEVEELYRINNKQNVHSLNIVGNDIEHYHLGRYRALTQVFPNLQELNEKNYAMMKRKQRGDMKKVIQKSSKLEYQLRKTLKKQMQQTDRAIFRMNPLLGSDQEQTQRTHHSHKKQYQQISDHRMTQKDEYSYQNEGGYSNRNYNSSLSRRSTSQIKSPKNAGMCGDSHINKRKREIDQDNQVYEVQQSGINPNSYSLGQSSKKKSYGKTFTSNLVTNRPQLKQVSLGNLQNVPITKSVKCLQKSSSTKNNNSNKKKSQQQKQNVSENNNKNQIPLQTVPITKNLLQIKTQDLDNQCELGGQLHQPTATFAMQKQRQQQCSLQNKQFMFRNKKPNNQFSINPNTIVTTHENNNTILSTHNNTSNNNPKAPKYKKQHKDQSQIFQQYEIDQDYNQMSLSRISRISEIPTKRLSHNPRSMTSHSLRPQQRSKFYQNYQNTSEQSFMTGNDFFPNQNNTYMAMSQHMAMSQLSQWRPNQSMDQDCLLKDKKDSLEEEKIVIATAVYMQNLLKKTLFALASEGTKRKNLPKKKVFF